MEELPAATVGSEAIRLAELVATGDWPAQCYAARLLALAGPHAKPAAPALDKVAAAALAEGRQALAVMLAGALANTGQGSAPLLVAAVEKGLRSSAADGTLSALKSGVALAAEGRSLLPFAVPLLQSPDAEVRALAARLVRGHGEAAGSAIPALAENLKHTEPFVVREAARALAAAGAQAAPAVPALREAIKRREIGVPEDALDALATVGPGAVAAYEDLAALLVADEVRYGADPRPRALSSHAERALSAMGSEVVQPLVDMIKKDRERGPIAARILGGMGSRAKAAGPLLLKTLQSVERDVRNAKMTCNLAAALIQIEPSLAEKTVPAFSVVLLSDDIQAATQAADFLIHLGVTTKDLYVREAIVGTLVQGLQAGAQRSKSNEEFGKLCGTICARLPEFGPAADAAVPVLKDCVFARTSFAAAAKRAWQTIRPNEKVSSAPSVESSGTSGATEKGGDLGLDL
jgi:hypothetical protein